MNTCICRLIVVFAAMMVLAMVAAHVRAAEMTGGTYAVEVSALTMGGGNMDSGFRMYVTNVPVWHIFNKNTDGVTTANDNALTILSENLQPAVKLTQDGRVGIGTDNPDYNLSVNIVTYPGRPRVGIKASGPSDFTAVRLISSNDVLWGVINQGPALQHEFTVYNSDSSAGGTYRMISIYTNDTMMVGTHVTGLGSADATVHIAGPGSSSLKVQNSFTPSGSADTAGTTGTISWDDNYIYIKTTAGWKRAALSAW